MQVSQIDPGSGTPVDPAPAGNLTFLGGYNLAPSGNWVVGGELGFSTTASHAIPAGTLEIGNALSVRGRAGIAAGDFLFYSTLGYLAADAEVSLAPSGFSIDGVTFGLGAEVMVTDGVGLRAEYTRGDLKLSGPGGTVDVTTDTLSLGAVFRF